MNSELFFKLCEGNRIGITETLQFSCWYNAQVVLLRTISTIQLFDQGMVLQLLQNQLERFLAAHHHF